MVVLTETAVEANAAGLHRLDRDQVADFQIARALAERHDFSAQLVTHDHRVLYPGERVRAAAGGDRSFVVLQQVAAADAVVAHAQLDLAAPGLRLGYGGEPQVLPAVVQRCAHRPSLHLTALNPRGCARPAAS